MKTYSENARAAVWVHLLGAVSSAGLMVLSPTMSSMAAEPEQASESAVPSLGVITVTAQRRAENNQRVPIAITTVTADQLQAQGTVSIQTLAASVPNLTTAGSFWANTYIRGVGTNSASPNNEPSVATYVDGVYNPSAYGLSSFYFNDLKQIEVLKGPQGTLFGRNATGGVIQIITADPKHEFGGHASLGYGNYDTINASAYLTGGITRNVAADLAAVFENQGTGWGYNPTYHTHIFWHHNVAARSKWLFTPSDSTKVTAAFDYSKYRSDGANNQLLPGSYASDHVTTFPGKYNAVGEVNLPRSERRHRLRRIRDGLQRPGHLDARAVEDLAVPGLLRHDGTLQVPLRLAAVEERDVRVPHAVRPALEEARTGLALTGQRRSMTERIPKSTSDRAPAEVSFHKSSVRRSDRALVRAPPRMAYPPRSRAFRRSGKCRR